MAKRLTGFMLCCLLAIFTSGCGKNNNIFSWAHRADNDTSYNSLMSDADSKTRNQNYADAAKNYRVAANLKHGDKEAVIGYASSVVHGAFGSEITNIVANVVKMTNTDTSRLSLSFPALSPEKIHKIDEELSDLVNNKNMFPALFDAGNSPTDTNTNFNGAIIYVLSGVFSAAKNPEMKPYVYVNDILSIDFNKLPRKSSATPAVELKVRNMRDKTLKAVKCLDNIKNKRSSTEEFKSGLNNVIENLNSWLRS